VWGQRQRTWRKHGLQPNRARQFKLSKDPRLAGSCERSSGFRSPARAVTLSIDEKSQIRVLEAPNRGCG
jgi:hypothetical protein